MELLSGTASPTPTAPATCSGPSGRLPHLRQHHPQHRGGGARRRGLTLPPLEPEAPDEDHAITVEPVEDEVYVTLNHPMTKGHFISFLAGVSDEGVQLIKLYPEGNLETRLKLRRMKWVYAYCNRHGLYRCTLP